MRVLHEAQNRKIDLDVSIGFLFYRSRVRRGKLWTQHHANVKDLLDQVAELFVEMPFCPVVLNILTVDSLPLRNLAAYRHFCLW